MQDGAALVVTRFGQPRLSRAPRAEPGQSRRRADRASASGRRPTPALAAPWDGEVVDGGADSVTLRGGEYELTLSGVDRCRAGHPCAPGDPLAEAASRPLDRSRRAPCRRARRAAVHDCRAGAGLAGAHPRSRAAARACPPPTRADAARSAGAPRREFRTGAGALLPQPAADRARLAALPDVHARAACYLDMVNNVTVLGHAHPRVADTAARQLRRLNTNSRFNYEAVVEFSERLAATAARPAGHRVPGQLRFGGKRSGDPAGDGRDRPTRRGRGPRGLPRLDVRHRRGLHVDRRQPECACHPPGLGAHGGVAEQLPRQVPRRRGGAVRRRGGRPDRGAGRRRPRHPRRSSARACTATRAAWRCPTATCSRCTRRCGPAAAWRSPTRCRSGTAGSANGSGDFSSRTSSPTSCRSPSRRATAIRWAR